MESGSKAKPVQGKKDNKTYSHEVYRNESQKGRVWKVKKYWLDRTESFDPGLALLEEDETGIADAALMSSVRKPIADNRVRACFYHSILVSLGTGNGCVQLRPVDIEHAVAVNEAEGVRANHQPEDHEDAQWPDSGVGQLPCESRHQNQEQTGREYVRNGLDDEGSSVEKQLDIGGS